MTRIHITQGRIIDPETGTDSIGDIYIADNRICSIMEQPESFDAEITIDARNQIICPGFIDLSARLREPGATQKATIASEVKAAAASGVTALCIPPDTSPCIDNPAVVELIDDKAKAANYEQIYPIGALTYKLQGQELSSMFALKNAGCIAVSNARMPIANLLILRRAMEYAASFDLLLIYRPQDYHLSHQGCAHEGAIATRYGLPAIPEIAETTALLQCLELVAHTGCKVHFGQISCARSIDFIRHAKSSGLPVSADVAIHQLHLTENDVLPFDGVYHVNPPFRGAGDRQALRKAVREGVVDAICSDHQPHNIDAKLGAFPETEPGVSSLETFLPLTLSLVNENELNLMQAIAALTTKPAKILGLETPSLKVGKLADLCIFDPEMIWQINTQSWLSSGRNTPFWQQNLQGKVAHTILNGRVIYSLGNCQ
jgi:dihydroorotase